MKIQKKLLRRSRSNGGCWGCCLLRHNQPASHDIAPLSYQFIEIGNGPRDEQAQSIYRMARKAGSKPRSGAVILGRGE